MLKDFHKNNFYSHMNKVIEATGNKDGLHVGEE